VTDSSGFTQTYEYSDLDHIRRIGYPDGGSVEYVHSGCCPWLVDSVTDRGGQTTRYAYDAFRNLTAVTDPEGGVMRFAYDKNLNLIRLTDPEGNATAFEYDLNNQVTKKIYADGTFERYAYDPRGLISKVTNARGGSVDYFFDLGRNLYDVHHNSVEPSASYAYDVYDRLIRIDDATGRTAIGYQELPRKFVVTVDGPLQNDKQINNCVNRKLNLSFAQTRFIIMP
jgi:YD repeat-containing protein